MLAMTVTMAVVLAAVPGAKAPAACMPVYTRLIPCMEYVTSGGLVPPSPSCCRGVRAVAMFRGYARVLACRCIEEVAPLYSGSVDYSTVTSLPASCGVHMPFAISPSIDCSK
ncbi:Non-specific lipid-transfer protein [Nymphaea thermarum]|nr:Non-specific lipid-transfer protein [Nymphaea thermarum]